ncbi:2'-5' RNA ligase family protein [Saccharomonospora piscinae]|uniref:2'-5' RNA ligase family protein n=1 Tax=Saccharomonospora piscinae TaxID=687388 RepID=UPI000462EFB1|nr:2'-5' RNA ligase family protein [Saccharomonospora piscinae]
MPDRVKLFSAVVPPPEVVTALRRELRSHRVEGDSALRWTAAARWHVTLGFYGHEPPEPRSRWLRERLSGQAATEVRLAGAGSFRGVLWLGVRGEGLSALAEAARPECGDRPYVGHLTLALARRGTHREDRAARAAIERWRRSLTAFAGPAWTAREVVLLRSDPAGEPGAGPRYGVVDRIGLDVPR